MSSTVKDVTLRVYNKSCVYLQSIANPVIPRYSTQYRAISHKIAQFRKIPCNEIPNFIFLFRGRDP